MWPDAPHRWQPSPWSSFRCRCSLAEDAPRVGAPPLRHAGVVGARGWDALAPIVGRGCGFLLQERRRGVGLPAA